MAKRADDMVELTGVFAQEAAAQSDAVWRGDPRAGNAERLASDRALGAPFELQKVRRIFDELTAET